MKEQFSVMPRSYLQYDIVDDLVNAVRRVDQSAWRSHIRAHPTRMYGCYQNTLRLQFERQAVSELVQSGLLFNVQEQPQKHDDDVTH